MNKKKTAACLLIIILLCSMGAQAFATDSTESYPDIDGQWAQNIIEEFTKRGYLEGYSDGTFRPDNPVTRAEAGAFVSRLGFPEAHPLIDYSDLAKGAWYYDAVRKATRTGFVQGYPDGTYRPDAFILRQEATKLASHFWGEVDMEGFQMQFTDTDRIAPWALPHMGKLVKMRLLDGYPDNTIRPENNLTRAEFVKLFYMILIEPVYTNVIVRAVDIDDPLNDIIEAKKLSREIGSTAVFDAPEVPSRWKLQGDARQTHVVEQGLEVVFEYKYIRPSGSSGSSGSPPVTKYILSLAAEPAQGGTVTGGGSYPAGRNVTVNAAVYDGYVFDGWYKQAGESSELVSDQNQFTYSMPAGDTTLVARFNLVSGDEECIIPELIADTNYNVDDILTITYNEEEDEFEDWRENAARIEIWPYESTEPDVIYLPHAGVVITTPGELTLDPAQIDVLQTAGYNYTIVVIGEEGCETFVVQYVQAGAVASLSYLPHRGITIDFDGQIYPGPGNYSEEPFVTTHIEVSLYDQYSNECRSGPSHGEYVYAEAAQFGEEVPGWTLESYDPNNSGLPENQAVSGTLGYAQFSSLKHTGAGLDDCYITFRVYKPGETHDETGQYVTVDTDTFDLTPVN